MSRDAQRQRAYNAEYTLRDVLERDTPTFDFFGSSLVLPQERKFGNVENVQTYVDRVLALNWVRATWPRLARIHVNVRERQGQDKAHYSRSEIEIAVPVLRNWALREIVMLHEIAHHLTPTDPGHAPEFCGTFIALVSEVIGPEVGLLLAWSMDQAGAKYVKVSVQTS